MAHMVSEPGKLGHTEYKGRHDNVARYTIGNFVVNVDWKELIAGMNRSRRECWKVKASRYCAGGRRRLYCFRVFVRDRVIMTV